MIRRVQRRLQVCQTTTCRKVSTTDALLGTRLGTHVLQFRRPILHNLAIIAMPRHLLLQVVGFHYRFHSCLRVRLHRHLRAEALLKLHRAPCHSAVTISCYGQNLTAYVLRTLLFDAYIAFQVGVFPVQLMKICLHRIRGDIIVQPVVDIDYIEQLMDVLSVLCEVD
jgi:hypothetical protein